MVRGLIDALVNNVIYMEFYSGRKMVHGKCGKTKFAGTIDRGSAVYLKLNCYADNGQRILILHTY
jgi:hypothetical protein